MTKRGYLTSTRGGKGVARDDAGFTMVELMASLTILAVGIVGVIGVMNSSFRVAGNTAARSRGVAVATRWIEKIRAIPYDKLIITPSVCVSPTNPACSATETVEGRTYDIRYVVTREDEQTGPENQRIASAYKKAYIQVTWRDQSGSHTIYQTTLLYPGGLGLHDAAASVVQAPGNDTPNPPTGLLASRIDGTTGVNLSWTAPTPAAGVEDTERFIIRYSKNSLFPAGQVQEVASALPVAITTLRVNDLTANTAYYFQVFSIGENGVPSPSPAVVGPVVTHSDPTVILCSVGTVTVTPAAIKKRPGAEESRLESPYPKVEINTLGACGSTNFYMEYFPRTSVRETHGPLPGSGGTYNDTLRGNQRWTVGEHDITVYTFDALGAKVVRATLRLIVCDDKKPTCP